MPTSQPLSLDADPSAAQLRAVLDAQRAAFLLEGPPTAQTRRDRINCLVQAVADNSAELTAAMNADFGNRPELFSLMSDMAGVLPSVMKLNENLETWMRDEVVAGSAETGLPTVLQHRPKGVVGVIGPWNFPLGLVIQPAAEALAAGNRVMIKFSDVPERTAEVFAEAIAERFAPEEVYVCRGGLETAQAFSDLEFDHLFFTGSPAVGRRVAAAAGANLVPVTLELGGKNPVVVAPNADVNVAAERIAANRMINGGQVCLCPDYVFVPTDQTDTFITAYREHIGRFFPTYLGNPDVTTVINDANYRRIVGLIQDAAAKGAEIITIAPAGETDSLPDPETRRIPPIIVLGVTDEMAIAREEIFGPVIAVFSYQDVSEAIDYMRARPHPLVAYWYGADTADYQTFLRLTTSGGVARNDIALHLRVDGAPFGGVGHSGMGYYHGKAGFDTFTHTRAITTNQLGVGIAPTMMPPYTDTVRDGLLEILNTARSATTG
ncbi:aldehyde dehydrogenase family protein [Streptomyces gardneri]|nr:aldehyde dehydrogenase family protein [Streptomyces gardneri]